MQGNGFEVIEINPRILKCKLPFIYFNIKLPLYCKRHLRKDDIFLIPNNFGGFWRIPHKHTWVIIHDLIPLSEFGYRGVRRWGYKYKINQAVKAERIITISYYVKRMLCNTTRVNDEKVKVLYWPSDGEFMTDCQKTPKQYLSIGTGEPRKSVDWLLKNWHEAADAESTLLLYGKEWRRGMHRRITELIKQYGLSDKVRLLGTVSEEELFRLYSSSAVFIYPSLEEGFGLPPLEALSHGCNIVLPKTPVNYELYGTIAFFYDPGDVVELRQALKDGLNGKIEDNMAYSKQFDIHFFQKNIDKIFMPDEKTQDTYKR